MADHTPTFFSPNVRTRAWAAMHQAAERDLKDSIHPAPPPYTVYARASGYPHCTLNIHERHDCHHQGHQSEQLKANTSLSNYINETFNSEPRLRLSIYIHTDNPSDNILQTSIHQQSQLQLQESQGSQQQHHGQAPSQQRQHVSNTKISGQDDRVNTNTAIRSSRSSTSLSAIIGGPRVSRTSPTDQAQKNYYAALDTLRIDYLKAMLTRHENHVTATASWRRKRAMKRAGTTNTTPNRTTNADAIVLHPHPHHYDHDSQVEVENHHHHGHHHQIHVHEEPICSVSATMTSPTASQHNSSQISMLETTSNGSTRATSAPIEEDVHGGKRHRSHQDPHVHRHQHQPPHHPQSHQPQPQPQPQTQATPPINSWLWSCRDFLARIGQCTTSPDMSRKERLAYLRQKRRIDERFGRADRSRHGRNGHGGWWGRRDEGDGLDQLPKNLEKALHHWTPWYPGQNCFEVEFENQPEGVGDIHTANKVRYGGNEQTIVLKY